jgi:hypothetical protein
MTAPPGRSVPRYPPRSAAADGGRRPPAAVISKATPAAAPRAHDQCRNAFNRTEAEYAMTGLICVLPLARTACLSATRIRRSGRSRPGTTVALRDDRWPQLSREIRLIMRRSGTFDDSQLWRADSVLHARVYQNAAGCRPSTCPALFRGRPPRPSVPGWPRSRRQVRLYAGLQAVASVLCAVVSHGV